MKLTIKTLKGEKFDVQVEETNTVAEVKTIIVSFNSWRFPLDFATLALN
jgi:hypothetical protein